jgi:hypothetical protein
VTNKELSNRLPDKGRTLQELRQHLLRGAREQVLEILKIGKALNTSFKKYAGEGACRTRRTRPRRGGPRALARPPQEPQRRTLLLGYDGDLHSGSCGGG